MHFLQGVQTGDNVASLINDVLPRYIYAIAGISIRFKL